MPLVRITKDCRNTLQTRHYNETYHGGSSIIKGGCAVRYEGAACTPPPLPAHPPLSPQPRQDFVSSQFDCLIQDHFLLTLLCASNADQCWVGSLQVCVVLPHLVWVNLQFLSIDLFPITLIPWCTDCADTNNLGLASSAKENHKSKTRSSTDIHSKFRALQVDLRAANAALATMTINYKQAVSAQEVLSKEKEVSVCEPVLFYLALRLAFFNIL